MSIRVVDAKGQATWDDLGGFRGRNRRGRVLVIANDQALRTVLEFLTVLRGCEARSMTAADPVTTIIADWRPEVILLERIGADAEMAVLIATYKELAGTQVPIVLFTDTPLAPAQVTAIGAASFLETPVSVEAFLTLLTTLVSCSA